jgi:hypothetical protein
MTDKPEAGYVRFWIEDGTEFATLRAANFRTAMNERDRLRMALGEVLAVWGQPPNSAVWRVAWFHAQATLDSVGKHD